MKLLIRCAFVALTIVIMACGSDEPTTVVPTTGTLRVRVIEASSQVPLENTIISVLPSGVTAATNALGELVVADLPAGTRTVVARLSGYSMATADVNVVAGKETPVAIQMSKGSSARGVVLCTVADGDGRLIAGAQVGPLSGATQLTDTSGAVVLKQLPTGFVKLTGVKDGLGRGSATVEVRADAITTVRITLLDHKSPVDGAILHFPLNGDGSEVLGGSSVDFTGEVLPAADRKGRSGYATTFTGAELSYVSAMPVPTAQELPLSVSFWIKPNGLLQNRTWLVSKYLHPTGEGFALFVEGSRLIGIYSVGNFSSYARSTGSVLPKPNEWTHVCMTFSESGTEVFLNGARNGSARWGNPFANTVTDEEFRIGYTKSTGVGDVPLPFTGEMDDLLWFDRKLTPEEVGVLAADK